MSSSRGLRVEDLLAGGLALGLAVFVSARVLTHQMLLTEEDYWALSFIASPAALLIFAAACRYAFRPVGRQGELAAVLGRIGGILRDWMPFLLFILAYETFQSSVFGAILPRDRDAELLALDRALCGETPAVFFDGFITVWLTEVLVVAYFLHLVLPPIVAFAWYGKDLARFREFLLAILLCGVVGSIGYVLVPAVGPAQAYPELFHDALGGALYDPTTGLLDRARVPRDVFPSLHVAISSLVLFYGARRGRIWLLVLLPLVLGNWVSTLYLRYHYFVDVIAGWVVAVLVIAGAQLLLALERGIVARRAGSTDCGALP